VLKISTRNREQLLFVKKLSVMTKEAVCSSETLVATYKLTWRHKPDHRAQLYRCENLK